MAKNQKKGSNVGLSQPFSSNPKNSSGDRQQQQYREKPARGCCGFLCGLVKTLFVLTALGAVLYCSTFAGYFYMTTERLPTLDEFKMYSTERFLEVRDNSAKYYAIADKHSRVYYAHFEEHYMPTIQHYGKEFLRISGEKLVELKALSCKYADIARKQAMEYYKLALKSYEDYQSNKATPAAAPEQKHPQTQQKPPAPEKPAPKPAAATTPKPTEAPSTTPKPVVQKPTEAPEEPKVAPAAAAQKPVVRQAATSSSAESTGKEQKQQQQQQQQQQAKPAVKKASSGGVTSGEDTSADASAKSGNQATTDRKN